MVKEVVGDLVANLAHREHLLDDIVGVVGDVLGLEDLVDLFDVVEEVLGRLEEDVAVRAAVGAFGRQPKAEGVPGVLPDSTVHLS